MKLACSTFFLFFTSGSDQGCQPAHVLELLKPLAFDQVSGDLGRTDQVVILIPQGSDHHVSLEA